MKKAQQRLYFLRRLRSFGFDYAVQLMLTFYITAYHGCFFISITQINSVASIRTSKNCILFRYNTDVIVLQVIFIEILQINCWDLIGAHIIFPWINT